MVLATLVRVEGGGPRPVGAQMAFTNTDLVGFLSGGCVEADVATQAAQVLASGTPRKLVYGRGSPYFDIQLLCGARIELMLERVSPSDDAVIRLLELTKARRSALSNGRDHHCLAEDEPAPKGWKKLAKHGRLVLEAAGETPGAYWIRFRPTIRTYVMGRDPTSMAAAMLSAQVGFETILVRPGGPSERPSFEIQHYWRGDIDSALAKFGADNRTAIVIANHDLEVDDAALSAALASAAGYVGVLGSRRHTHARIQRLRAAGTRDQQLERLKSPIGLPLGSKAPWSIALAIVAGITTCLGT
jgi:xanthine dehydrogenase accessory factor